MKGFASALSIVVAATKALTQSIGPESMPSEEFEILTIHRHSPLKIEFLTVVLPLTYIYKHGH